MKSGWRHIVRVLMGIVLTTALFGSVVDAQTPIGTRIDNRGVLRYRTADGGVQDSALSNTASLVVTGSFTLGLGKSVSPSTAFPGDTVTYTISASNSGSGALSGVVVLDTIPGELTLLSATQGSWVGNVLRWNVGALGMNAHDTLRLSALVHQKIPAGLVVTNRCLGTDTTGSRIVSTADLTIGAAPRLDLQKSVSRISVNEGDTISYAIRFSNAGNITLSAFTLRDTLPGTVQFLNVSGGAQVTDSIIVFTKDSLTINESDSLLIGVIVRNPLAGGAVITNTVHARTNQTTDQLSSAQSTVRGQAALSFSKSASVDTTAMGDTVRFTLRFRNTGNTLLTNLIVTDSIPNELTYLASLPAGQFVNGVLSLKVDSLNFGIADSLLVVTRASAVLYRPTTVINHADILSDQTAKQYGQASIVYLPVRSTPVVTFVKSGPATSFAGDTAVYKISIQNHGPGPLTGIIVADTLDPVMSFQSASQGGVFDTSFHQITWSIPELDSAATDTLTASIIFNDTLSRPSTVTNRAGIIANEIASLQSQVQTLVRTRARLEVWKVVSPKRALQGDTVGYTITVQNVSATRADSVRVSDVLPAELDFLSALPAAQYVPATKSCSWKFDSLSAGGQMQIRLKAIVRSRSQMGEETVTNIASLQWSGGQANSSLDSRSDATVTLIVPYLQITKQAVRRIVEIGDLALYSITVTNLSSTTTAYQLSVVDNPPLGFHYAVGSSFRDSVKIADPAMSGNALRWNLADSLKPGASIHFTYRLIVGAGALDGTGINRAQALALAPGAFQISSSIASDGVQVRAGVFTDRGIIVGKVFYDDNENKHQDEGEEGIKGVELLMEDGTRIVTGDDGKYSLPEVVPGDHVIRVRQETLPQGDELLLGYDDFANVPSSRFVHVTESGIARADFYVRRASVPLMEFSQRIARIGAMSVHRTAEPKNLLFVKDESLAPVSIKGTQFESGKAALRPEAFPTLKAVADYAREFPNQIIAISGHTDATPIHTKQFPSNQELSAARALAVRQYLVTKEHIDSARITTIGFGETQPVASNATKSGRALNRRVEMMMTAGSNPFDNYFKIVHVAISLDYDGAVPLSRVEVHDRIDTSFHFVAGSGLLDHRTMTPSRTGNGLTWRIDGIGTHLHRKLTYDLSIYSPKNQLDTAWSTSSLTCMIGDSILSVDGSCTTANVVARTVRSKPIRFVMSGVLFDPGKATLKPEAMSALKSAADALTTYPHATATIDGFTDARPMRTKEFPSNVALSHARARAVLSQLVTNFGIDSSRLKATGWGELKPVASNSTADGQRANRRFEINIDKQEIRENVVREGGVDSSSFTGQEIRDLRGAAVYDTTAQVVPGDHFYINISAHTPSIEGPFRWVLIDSLPGGLALVSKSVRALRGIDSTWSDHGVLYLKCSPNDSVHAYSYLVEAAGHGLTSSPLEHRVFIRTKQKNGKEVVQGSQPFFIRIKPEGEVR